MTEDGVQSGMQSIFESVFRRTDIEVRPELTAADVPGFDSFRYISIIMATEERFGIKFSDADIDQWHNVGDLMAAVRRKLAL